MVTPDQLFTINLFCCLNSLWNRLIHTFSSRRYLPHDFSPDKNIAIYVTKHCNLRGKTLLEISSTHFVKLLFQSMLLNSGNLDSDVSEQFLFQGPLNRFLSQGRKPELDASRQRPSNSLQFGSFLFLSSKLLPSYYKFFLSKHEPMIR